MKIERELVIKRHNQKLYIITLRFKLWVFEVKLKSIFFLSLKLFDPGADGPVDSLYYPFYIKENVESCSIADG